MVLKSFYLQNDGSKFLPLRKAFKCRDNEYLSKMKNVIFVAVI
jgi:spore coat polysaccharide biosynthesis predicted glycosyltransferase SpsG